jgi:hypothetical protein
MNEVEDCGDNGRPRLANHVDAIVVAHAVFACGYEPLRFVGPKDQQIVPLALLCRFVEAAQSVRVEQHFEKCVDIAPLHLELLRHRHANDLAAIQISEVETVSGGAENLGDFWSDEWLEIIGDRFFHAADLLWRLREKTIRKMLGEFAPAHRLMTGREVSHRFVQIALIEKQMICVFQRHIGADLAQTSGVSIFGAPPEARTLSEQTAFFY